MDSQTPDQAASGGMPQRDLEIADLANQLYLKRRARDMTLAQASEEIGVSAATLSRFERLRNGVGHGPIGESLVPDMRTVVAVARWLQVAPTMLTKLRGADLVLPASNNEPASVPDIVEAHLRADRNLDEEAALALMRMFRMAYDQFSRLKRTTNGDETQEPRQGGSGEEG